MVKPIRLTLSRSFLWIFGIMAGALLLSVNVASAITFSSTPAITSATFESTGSVTALIIEFNRPVWNDAALTGALATTDFTYTDVSAAGAASITAIAHTAGDDFAVLTLNADPVAGDTADTIGAVANNIFTVGGALSEKTVTLTDDAGTAPAITSATVLSGRPRILVTFNKRVWSDDTSAAPPTTAPAVADFVGTTPGGDGCATAASAYAANLLTKAGARSVLLDCGENASAADTGGTPDTIAAATATSLFDAWGNDMGTGTTNFTSDAAAPTIIRVEAVKDSTLALITFSEPVFTDDPATTNNPGTIANTDFTYTDGATGGAASLSSITATTVQMLMGTGSGNSYALLTLNANVAVNDLSGGASNDTIDAAASGTAVFDALGNGLATGGTVANRTLNDTTNPVLISATINKSGATGQNTLALVYSEDVQATGFTAGGESIASTTTIGDMTTACTPVGFGAFSGNSGNLTYATLLNTVALNAGQTTFTITMAGQTGGYRTSTAAAAACTDGTGDTFTPAATVTDVAPTVNTIEAASLLKTHAITSAWDVANPITMTAVTPSSQSTTSITYGWTAVTDAGTDFREYKFFYGTTTGSGAALAGTQWGVAGDAALTTRTTTTTTTTGLTAGTIYFVTPYVFDTFGNAAAAGTEFNIQTNSGAVSSDRTAPAAPTGFTVTSVGGKAVLAWTDPTATDLKDIIVLRGKNEFPVSGNTFAVVLKGVKTYTDGDVMAGDTVKYILRARDNNNNSSVNSEEKSVLIVAATPAPADTTTPPPTDTVTPPAEGEAAEGEGEGEAVEGEGEGEAAEGEGEGEGEPAAMVTEEFSDIAEDHWAVQVIQYYFELGVVQGYSDGTFKPGKTANRAEALKMIMAANEIEVGESVDEAPFNDVATSAWFAPYAAVAKEQGFVKGRNGRFEGGSEINRAEVLALILQVSGAELDDFTPGGDYSFKDVKSGDWFYKYVLYAAENDIVKGYGDSTFKPGKAANRAEILQMLAMAQGGVYKE